MGTCQSSNNRRESIRRGYETCKKNIADKGRLAIEQVMKLIPYADGCEFSKGLDAEAEAFAEVFGTEDATEGVQAFIEKRKPVFKDK